MDFVAVSFWQMKQQKAQFNKDVSTLISVYFTICVKSSRPGLISDSDIQMMKKIRFARKNK